MLVLGIITHLWPAISWCPLFFWDFLFVPFRTQANEARTNPPKKWTTLVFGSNDLPEGPQDPPGPGVSDTPAPRTPLDPRNDPPKDRDLDLHRRPVGPKQGLQKFRLQAPNKVSKNSVCDTGAHYSGVVPINFGWCPLG